MTTSLGKIVSYAVTVLLFLILVACSSGGGTSGTGGELLSDASTIRRFTGVITSRTDNTPLANVEITIDETGTTATTDENGRFDFESSAVDFATLIFNAPAFEVAVVVEGLESGVAGAEIAVIVDEQTNSIVSSEVVIIDSVDQFSDSPVSNEPGASPGDAGSSPGTPGNSGPGSSEPTICTLEYAPVCGTNGQTYGNRCQAEAEGAVIAYAGECGSGICPEIYAPVCGVDGVTYSSLCVADAAGVAIRSQGECPSTSKQR
jgi:hypothetical protein